ncbi:MAG TPA: LysM domain-containing protein [Gaiellaceae bacterium]
MASRGWRAEVKRYAAPVAFLAAVTIAVLLVRSGLQTDSSSSTTPETTVATTHTVTTRHRRPQYYRLRAGETISDVALRFKTTVAALLALNPKIRPTQLSVGERIRVR